MPDYGQIDRKRGELTNLRQIRIEDLEEYEKWFAGQSFGESPRSQQYQQICQTVLDSLRGEIDRKRREEREDRRNRESRRQDLPWKIAGVAIAIVAVLISAVVAIHNIFFSNRFSNTGDKFQQRHTITKTNSNSATVSKPARIIELTSE